MNVCFTVPGDPVGKGRPRFTKNGHAYTPKKTVDYEDEIRKAWQEQAGGAKVEGAIKAEIVAVFSVPKSTSKKAREKMLSGQVRPTKKPDADNIAKCIDALNGLAFDDDAAIVELNVTKIYGEKPGVTYRLRAAEREGEHGQV